MQKLQQAWFPFRLLFLSETFFLNRPIASDLLYLFFFSMGSLQSLTATNYLPSLAILTASEIAHQIFHSKGGKLRAEVNCADGVPWVLMCLSGVAGSPKGGGFGPQVPPACERHCSIWGFAYGADSRRSCIQQKQLPQLYPSTAPFMPSRKAVCIGFCLAHRPC